MYLTKLSGSRWLHSRADEKAVESLIWTWLGLQIAGQVLLSCLLVTLLFSKRLKTQRHPTIVNFVVTWLLSTFPAQILLYSGTQAGPQPPPTTCVVNAALMGAVPPMEAVAFLSVMIQLWIAIRTAVENKMYSPRVWHTVVLLASPYVAFIGFAFLIGSIGIKFPQDVARGDQLVFCSVSHHGMAESIWGFTSFIVSITFVVQSWIAVVVYRNWRAVRIAKVASELDTHLIFRCAAFTVFEFFIVATSLIAIFDPSALPPKFMEATAPIVVFLILASQPDVLYSWFPCVQPPESNSMPPMYSSTGSVATWQSESRNDPLSEPVHFPRGGLPVPHRDITRAAFTPRTPGHSRSASSNSSLLTPTKPGHTRSASSTSSMLSTTPLLRGPLAKQTSHSSLRHQVQLHRAGSGESFHSRQETQLLKPLPAVPRDSMYRISRPILTVPPPALVVTDERGRPASNVPNTPRSARPLMESVTEDTLEFYTNQNGRLT